MKPERYEDAFLALSGVLLVVFLGALFLASRMMGIHVPSRDAEIDPAEVATTPPFDEPGVREVGPGRYEVVMVGRAWTFSPSEVRIPAGSEVTFRATSGDVLHGLVIEGTRVNLMLIPGQVTVISQRFDEPGEHLILCHEYCGVAHHTMFGRVIVQ